MIRRLSFLMLVVITSTRPCTAQEWLKELPKKPADELTFSDFQAASQKYYKQHPVEAAREQVAPRFHFSSEEAGAKKALEEYKQFKRWEWFTEPRVFPTGRWDSQKVIAAFQRIPGADAAMVNKLKLSPTEIARGHSRSRADRSEIATWPQPFKTVVLSGDFGVVRLYHLVGKAACGPGGMPEMSPS